MTSVLLMIGALAMSSVGVTMLASEKPSRTSAGVGTLLIGLAMCLCIEAGRHLP